MEFKDKIYKHIDEITDAFAQSFSDSYATTGFFHSLTHVLIALTVLHFLKLYLVVILWLKISNWHSRKLSPNIPLVWI